jgi:hypothetical protein
LVILQRKNKSLAGCDENDPCNNFVAHASHLCDDLVDEENESNFLDGECNELVTHDSKQIKARRKKSYDKTNVRRSTQIQIKKSKQ